MGMHNGLTPPSTRSERSVLYNVVYISTALAIPSIMFVTSGVQFLWIRLFTLGWSIDKNTAVTGFLVATGVGGALGMVVGPQIIDKCGGFDDSSGKVRSLLLIVSF